MPCDSGGNATLLMRDAYGSECVVVNEVLRNHVEVIAYDEPPYAVYWYCDGLACGAHAVYDGW